MGSKRGMYTISVPNQDLACPICRDLVTDVYSAPCGHSFCYNCILQNLEHRPLCPCCNAFVAKDKIYPNAMLSKLVRKAETIGRSLEGSALDRLKHAICGNDLELSTTDIAELQRILQDTKSRLEMEDGQSQILMLRHFLSHAREKKQRKVTYLEAMLDGLNRDIEAVESQKTHISELRRGMSEVALDTSGEASTSNAAADVDARGVAGGAAAPPSEEVLNSKRQLAFSQFDDLAASYMGLRKREHADDAAETSREIGHKALMGQPPSRTGSSGGALEDFARTLSVYMYQNQLEVLSEVRLNTGMLSCMEFNSDGSVIATAGVSKCIQVLDAEALKRGGPGAGNSLCNMVTRAKLSSLSWNKFTNNQLVSSDNEGVLLLWDASLGQIVQDYEAHEKRIWSVDFSPADPYLLASGSDDGKVKIWSTKQQSSVLQLDVRVNVCSVSYCKADPRLIAVGSADHVVRVFDLRKPSAPVNRFMGHSKAISYVDFLSQDEVMSASTDSTLRLWDIPGDSAVRVFSGHRNTRNFVGMAVDKDFIACGSEQTEVFLYYKALSKPVVAHSFNPTQPNEFMSALNWQPNTSTLFAVSSSGLFKSLRLTSTG